MKTYVVKLEYKFTVKAENRDDAEFKAIEKVADNSDCPRDVFVFEQEDQP